MEYEQNKTDIEEEKNNDTDGYITNPFSTKDIKITNVIIPLYSIIDMLADDDIDLNPDFQRHQNLWSPTSMSRLIESILLKLPLPIFYFDVSNPDKWIVVDGLQRLSTIKQFAVKKVLKLKNLEFLKDLEGKSYDDLEKGFKRIINNTQIITYQIEAQTPKKVRYSIFNRINTGGLTLNAQEIRQALNQDGKGVEFLKNVSKNELFEKVVNVSSKRMLDRELVLRFVAFKLTKDSYKNFPSNNMGEFLDEAMEKLDKIKDDKKLKKLEDELINTLEFSEKILGENHRFSRYLANKQKKKTLNRSLYDVITVCFSQIEDREKFISKKDKFISLFLELLKDESGEFSKAIIEGTSGKRAIETRFKILQNLIKEVLDEN